MSRPTVKLYRCRHCNRPGRYLLRPCTRPASMGGHEFPYRTNRDLAAQFGPVKEGATR